MSRDVFDIKHKTQLLRTGKNARKIERLADELQTEKDKVSQEKVKLKKLKKELELEKKELRVSQQGLLVKSHTLQREQDKINRHASLNSSTSMHGSLDNVARRRSQKHLNKSLDKAQAELAITKRKLLKAQKGGNKGDDGAKLRALQKRWRVEKKKLKNLMKEFEERARYYETQLMRFKNMQDKWIKQQRKKNKNVIIKYVFIDDIKQIKLHHTHKDRVRIVTKNGEEALLTNINITHEKKSKHLMKKKNKQDDLKWMKQDALIENVLNDIANDKTVKKSDDDDIRRGDISEWLKELQNRNDDLSILLSVDDDITYSDLLQGVIDRNNDRFGVDNDDDNKSKNDDDPMVLLKDNCDEYVDKLQSTIDIINQSSSMPNASPIVTARMSSNRFNFVGPYITELDARIKDICAMQNVFYSSSTNDDKSTFNKLSEILNNIDDRSDKHSDLQLVGSISNWKLELQEYIVREAIFMNELTERRTEIKEIFSVLDANMVNKALVNRLKKIVKRIEERHHKVKDIIKNAKQDLNDDDDDQNDDDDDDAYADLLLIGDDKPDDKDKIDLVSLLQDIAGIYKDNELWRQLMNNIKTDLIDNDNKATMNKALSVDKPDASAVRGIDFNEDLKYLLLTGDDDDDNNFNNNADWWLMKNQHRNEIIHSLHVSNVQNDKLTKLGVFISRILKYDINNNDSVTKLYIPIDVNKFPSAQFRVLATLFDGVIIAKLLHIINEDLIDFRAINIPLDLSDPLPLKTHAINENIAVILSTLKSMGINLRQLYHVRDWWNDSQHSKLLIDLLTQISHHTLDKYCSLKKNRELIILKKLNEDYHTLKHFNGDKFIIRWINYLLKRCGDDNIDIDNDKLINFNRDFIKICDILQNNPTDNDDKYNIDNNEIAILFIKIAKDKFNVITPIQIEDFAHNNRYCQNYFAAQIFDKINGLKLNDNDNDIKSADDNAADENEDDAVIAWINSFGLRNRADDLGDITSGVILLRILDKLKKGCINWRKTKLKVKHKFDKVSNCNYSIDIMTKKLGFRFVNMQGSDIVDCNKTLINSILWRLMRFQSIKIVADLEFGGKSNTNQVTNNDIIKWCNKKLLNDSKCKKIKSLNDSSLTTGLYYAELARSIIPNSIDISKIHYNIPPKSQSDQNNDIFYKKRKENMKYVMTIIRRYGTDLFITVIDLLRLEQRAVISILAALMTISLSKENIIVNKKKDNFLPKISQTKDKKKVNVMADVDDDDDDNDLDLDNLLDDALAAFK